MKKELGKWFMDIAKYMVTAILLTSVFNEFEQIWLIITTISAAVIILLIGLKLVKDNEQKKE